jgi:fatty-acyl-CoA synthase
VQTELLTTDFLDRARRYYGTHEAVRGAAGERLSYDELGGLADGFAAALQARGLEAGDRVAVLDPNTHYHLAAAYGTMQAGGVHTPLNYRLTADDFAFILSDARVRAIFADHEYAPAVESIRDEVPTEVFVTDDPDAVDGNWESFDDVVAAAGEYDRPDLDESALATINYTSGTTGDPKGVCRTHRTETVHAYLVATHQEIRDDDVYYWSLPMFHVNGWGHIYAITGAGARHVCTRGVDAEAVFAAIREEDVSYLCAAPTVLNRLIDYYETADPPTTGANPVRVATAGSAPPEATVRTVEETFGWHLKHVYGATETGPLVTTSDARRFYAPDDDARFALKKRQGIGYLGTDVRVVDEDGEDVPWDDETVGEIVVRGNQVMDGYWERPEETEAAFDDRVTGYYHMGDLAVVDENGFVSIQDRKKDIIVSGGENISSIELEDTLFDHDAVADVAVVPVPSDEWGETPKAFVVPASGDPASPGVTADALLDYCRDRLASYKALREVEFVAELPKTATGKVRKYELREREWADEDRMIGEG